MLSSHYRPTDFLWTYEGTPAGAAPCQYSIIVPHKPVSLVIDDGHPALSFPAKREWYEGVKWPSKRSFPDWLSVGIDPVKALESFLRIKTVYDAQLFAQRYGPMWLCHKHSDRRPVRCYLSPFSNLHEYGCVWSNIETVEEWFLLSRQMSALLSVSAELRGGGHLTAADWQAMTHGHTTTWKPPHEQEGDFVRVLINRELVRFRIGPLLSRDLQFVLSASVGILPVLWLQLAIWCAGGRTLAVCSGCSLPYVRRHRAPRRGQRNYCQSCNSSGVRQRLSYQAKKNVRS